jgi:hypothetical protein
MTNSFWNVDLANLVTWILIVAGYVGSQYVQTKLLTQRMNGFSKWVEKHEIQDEARDAVQIELKVATEKLTVLAALAERRLERLEDK